MTKQSDGEICHYLTIRSRLGIIISKQLPLLLGDQSGFMAYALSNPTPLKKVITDEYVGSIDDAG